MIEIYDQDSQTDIQIINQLVSFELTSNKNNDNNDKLYRKMSFNLSTEFCGFCQESFKTMCQTIASFLISQQIPFELDITFDEQFKSEFTKTYYPIFEKYILNQDLMNNFESPMVNEYCKVFNTQTICVFQIWTFWWWWWIFWWWMFRRDDISSVQCYQKLWISTCAGFLILSVIMLILCYVLVLWLNQHIFEKQFILLVTMKLSFVLEYPYSLMQNQQGCFQC